MATLPEGQMPTNDDPLITLTFCKHDCMAIATAFLITDSVLGDSIPAGLRRQMTGVLDDITSATHDQLLMPALAKAAAEAGVPFAPAPLA